MEPTRRKRSTPRARLGAITTLARWQLGETWRLLLLTGAGMIVATILVCTLPLYSEVALSAGLRDVLGASPGSASLVVQAALQSPSSAGIAQMTRQLQADLQDNLGAYVTPGSQLSAQVAQAAIYAGNPGQQPGPAVQPTANSVVLHAFAQKQLAAHVTLLQGRLPQPANSLLEIALTPQTAQQMHVGVGDTLYVASPLAFFLNGSSSYLTWHLQVVGLFTPDVGSDPFWQGASFGSEQTGTVNGNSVLFDALLSNEALFAAFNNALAAHPTAKFDNYNQPTLTWSYRLDVTRLDAARLDDLTNRLGAFQSTATNLDNASGLTVTNVTGPGSLLAQYDLRTSLARVPQGVLLLLVVGMVLLFIGLMMNLLIEQRMEAIAVLRSRGASRRQIFGAFTAQTLALGVATLIIGPLLAIPVARLLAQGLLSASDQQALNLIGGNPFSLLVTLWPFSLAAVGVTVGAILLALFQATRVDVLALRQEAARPRQRPLWQRLFLDVLLLVLALGGYGYTLYVEHTGTLDAQTGTLILAPLLLLSSSLFLVALLLVFLRCFSAFSSRAARLAARRGKGAGPMLALAQIARTPRQATRMLLLLTLATAFAVFALVFSASQTQRISDIAGYEAGADFSGRILDSQPALNAAVPGTQAVQSELARQSAQYQTIPGVLSASMGAVGALSTAQSSQLTIKAVDASTFAYTAIWTTQDSSQSLSSLMAQLVARRASALADHVVPAIVDAATWQSLRLSNGKQFALQLIIPDPSEPGGTVSTTILFQAIAQVQHIPTLSDSSSSLDPASNGGILVDYQSAADGYAHATPQPQPLPVSYVWLRTAGDAAALASVRSALGKKIAAGFAFADRRELIATLQHDPVTIDLGGILALGTLTPLILAIIGSLLASWQGIRARLLSFVLLRALGSTPRQLAGMLSWEQGALYLLMLGFGLLASLLLSLMVLPALVVTSIASADQAGVTVSSGVSIQQILPSIRVVIPSALGLVLALLLVACLVAQVIMVRVIVRPSPGQALRLNAD